MLLDITDRFSNRTIHHKCMFRLSIKLRHLESIRFTILRPVHLQIKKNRSKEDIISRGKTNRPSDQGARSDPIDPIHRNTYNRYFQFCAGFYFFHILFESLLKENISHLPADSAPSLHFSNLKVYLPRSERWGKKVVKGAAVLIHFGKITPFSHASAI